MVSNPRHFRPPWLARLGAVLFSIVALAWAPAMAQVAVPKKAARKFTPEMEAKFDELMKKLKEEKSKDEGERMKSEMEEVVKITGLDGTGQKALEAPIAAAIESSVKDWLEKSETSFRNSWNPDTDPEVFERWMSQASMIVRNGYGTEYERATDLPAWKEALARTLDAKQAAAWKAAVDEKTRKFDEEIKNVVAAAKERAREQSTQSMLDMASTMKLTLSLDEDRTAKLQKLGEQAADKASESVKTKVRKLLLNSDETRRNQILKTNSLYVPPDENDVADKQEVWKEGLKQVLTPEEIQKWDGTLVKRRERRVRTMAQVLVWTMDQAVAFTARQREQIQPMAEVLVEGQAAFFAEYRANMYSSLGTQYFYQAAAQANEEDLAKILDARQVELWKSANPQTRRTKLATRATPNAATEKATVKPRGFEPEELEAAISDYLYLLAGREEERSIAEAVLRVEDAIRVASVEGKAVQRLQIAARGAAEQEFEMWKTTVSTSIRSQVQNSTPEDVERMMKGAGYYNIGRRKRLTDDSRKGVLDAAFATELTETQRAAWQKEVDARKAYEQQVIAGCIIGELDRMCLLTQEQWSKLEPLLTEILKEYGPDFSQMFSSQESWFLQSYYMMTPLAGVPQDQMQPILTEAQWKQWNSSTQFSNCKRYWENIQTSHKTRVKSK